MFEKTTTTTANRMKKIGAAWQQIVNENQFSAF